MNKTFRRHVCLLIRALPSILFVRCHYSESLAVTAKGRDDNYTMGLVIGQRTEAKGANFSDGWKGEDPDYNFPRLNLEKSMKEQEGRERQELGSGNSLELGRALEASPDPKFSSCFLFNLDATQESYNQDPPLSIHPKMLPFCLHALPVILRIL